MLYLLAPGLFASRPDHCTRLSPKCFSTVHLLQLPGIECFAVIESMLDILSAALVSNNWMIIKAVSESSAAFACAALLPSSADSSTCRPGSECSQGAVHMQAFVAAHTGTATHTYSLQLAKGKRDRLGEDAVASKLMLNAVAAACGMPTASHADIALLPNTEHVQVWLWCRCPRYFIVFFVHHAFPVTFARQDQVLARYY